MPTNNLLILSASGYQAERLQQGYAAALEKYERDAEAQYYGGYPDDPYGDYPYMDDPYGPGDPYGYNGYY